MSQNRFFLTAPLPEGRGPHELSLSASDVHHALTVLRMKAGDMIAVVEPEGDAWLMRVSGTETGAVFAELWEPLRKGETLQLTLVMGVSKGHKVDLVVEKVTELGVEAIRPVITERSVVRLSGEKGLKRSERWQRVARAAAKQSERTSIPKIADPVPLKDILKEAEAFDTVLVPWEEASATGPGIGEALDEMGVTSGSRVAVVVGPEGGLTAEEVYALEAVGARAVTLGRTVLRSETAGIVAVALCLYELGALGGRERG